MKGPATGAVVEAGVDPKNGVFLDNGDQLLGGTASRINSITIKGAVDNATRFVAGAFGKAKIPKKVVPATDPHFLILT